MNEWMMKEFKLIQDTATEAKKALFNRLQPTNQPTDNRFLFKQHWMFFEKNTVVQCVWEKKIEILLPEKKRKGNQKKKNFLLNTLSLDKETTKIVSPVKHMEEKWEISFRFDNNPRTAVGELFWSLPHIIAPHWIILIIL